MPMTLLRSWLAATSTTLLVVFAVPVANAAPLPVKVEKFEGEVVQVRGTEHRGIDKDRNIEAGTQIQTGVDGRAQLSLLGAPTIALGQKADLLLHSIDQHVLRLRLASGAMRVDTRSAAGGKSRDVRINVGDLRLRVAAADAWTEIDERGGQVCLISGRIEAQQSTGPVRLDTPGQCLRQAGATSQWSMVPAAVLEARMAMLVIRDAPVVAIAPPAVVAPSPKPPTRIVIVTPEAVAPPPTEVATPAPAVVAIIPESKPVPVAPAAPKPADAAIPSAPEVAAVVPPQPLPPVVIVPAPVEVAKPAAPPKGVVEPKPIPDPAPVAKPAETLAPAKPVAAPEVAVIAQPPLPSVVVIPKPAEVATPAPKPVVEPRPEPAPVAPSPVTVVETPPAAPAVKAQPVPTKPKPVALEPEIERTPVASSVALAPAPAMDVPVPIEAPAVVVPTPAPVAAAEETASGADAQISSETAAVAQALTPEADVQTPPPATPIALAVPQTAAVLAPEAAPAPSKPEPNKAPAASAETAPAPAAAAPEKSEASKISAESAAGAKESASTSAAESAKPAATTEVAVAAPVSAEPAAPEIDDGRRWRVVLGSMPEKEKADLEVERLNSRGWAVEAREYRVGERHGFRIGFGEFATRELAQVALDEFLVQYPEATGWLAKY